MIYPKISIVTPSYNKAPFLEECIRSILNQEYPNLEYIIIDGGSTDHSVSIINKYEPSLKYWVSEKDQGMYHAIQKGFDHSTGEIMGWLNSDDILHPKSLFTIAEIFSSFEKVEWIQGHPTVIDDMGRILYNRNARNNKFDFYQKKYKDGIFIQQESTYWRRNLWEKAGSTVSTVYKYAGDFELWMRFFNHAGLFNTSAMIGAFRVSRNGQLSTNNYEAYLQECDQIINKMVVQLEEEDLRILRKITSRLFFIKKTDSALKESLRVDYNFSKNAFYLSQQ